MWRKPTEVNPSSQPSTAAVPSATRHEEASKIAASQTQLQARSSPSETAVQPAAAPASSNISKIGSGLKIQGELSGSADLYIDGDVQGKIRLANARVTVGPNGRVRAEIEARDIVIDGSVQGNLKAGESARLGASSRVVGSIVSPRIGIEDGARLQGKVETVRPAPLVAPPATETNREADDLSPVGTGIRSE
ncbi:MAG TPA: polymer-forming cytoskeletal protein [Candidatus Acidoferrum sp.]|jgi:cytoskeletal protein CcmA (bactofilin family)|nr:polymer-forming cytoskeletal protein [Candidatus Acidoferrum sp.]